MWDGRKATGGCPRGSALTGVGKPSAERHWGMMPVGCRGWCHPLRGAGHDKFKMLRQVPSLRDAGHDAYGMPGQVPSLRGAGHDDFTMPGQVLLELGAEDAPLCV